MLYPNRIIRDGEPHLEVVRFIQSRLNDLGYGPFLESGIFGPKTKAAIQQFQATHRDNFGNSLEPDGQVGAITWEALFDEAVVHIEEPDETNSDGSLAVETVLIARSQIGVMEDPPNSNRGDKVNSYLKSCGCDPGNFWCAAFVYWCFNEASKKIGGRNPLPRTAGCLAHWNNTSGKKITSDQAVDNPSVLKPGDVFIMDFGNGHGHTGIVTGIAGGFVKTIEGNSNTGGSRNGIGVFPLQRKINKVKGFIRYA